MAQAKAAVPKDWTIAQVQREDLDRFLFTCDDIVLAIGQDGLVANLAKYVKEQPIVGLTPDPEATEGILAPLRVEILPRLLPQVALGEVALERRAMVEARLGEGQSLAALNELFIGHRSHQSARYDLRWGGMSEFQSSSGVIVATGTGLSGWARSIMAATGAHTDFGPEDPKAAFFAREPWPSKVSGCRLRYGEIGPGEDISVLSRMNDGGLIFADGIEQDFLKFDWGIEARVTLAGRSLNLVRGV